MRGAPLMVGLLVRKDPPIRRPGLKGQPSPAIPARTWRLVNMSDISRRRAHLNDVRCPGQHRTTASTRYAGLPTSPSTRSTRPKVKEADAPSRRHISDDCSPQGEARMKKAGRYSLVVKSAR